MAPPATNAIAIPPFLTPSKSEFDHIFKVLASREQARRVCSHRSHQSTSASVDRLAGRNDPDADPYSTRVGTSRDNMRNNRYGDIIAYDSTRILLPSTDRFFYVNASLVTEPDLGFPAELLPRRHWVAAQGPTGSTVPSFLSLLLHAPTSPAFASSNADQREVLPLVNLIVQLTPLVEQNREKCAPYFPSDRVGEEWFWSGDEREDGGDQGVWVRFEGREDAQGVEGERRSWLRVGTEGDEQGRRVLHVEYLGWRDHGVPSSPSHLLSFINRMNKLNASLSSNGEDDRPAPILLHCSAGVGRTGTYLSISSLLPLLSLLRAGPELESTLSASTDGALQQPAHSLKEEYPVDSTIQTDSRQVCCDFVGLTVDRIRDQRTTMVQTKDQLEFVYNALQTAWTESSSTVESG